jgi:hypothetical protein
MNINEVRNLNRLYVNLSIVVLEPGILNINTIEERS